MNGIVIGIDPVIFNIGDLEIRWYSMAIMLAIAVGIFITVRQANKKGIEPRQILSGAFWVVISAILGARLFHVIDHFDYYMNNPSQIFQFQGLAIWGAMVGGGLALIIYTRIRHIPLGRLVDALVPGLIVAQIIGRVGCIINGDAYGGVTDLPWAFIYTHPGAMIPDNLLGVPTHPYPLYEMIWNATVLVFVLRLGRYFKQDGLVFLSYLSLYSVGRIIFTFVRQENLILGGLQQAQIIALITIAASVALMVYISRKKHVHKRIP
ncbi:MAG: prolipoprotein diacylglyceryl transferase [Dehalococcoidia bacterium]|nr:MAG: prolipoprotein diacylglyceryl transferase [Dehalococcoidia bacterium]